MTMMPRTDHLGDDPLPEPSRGPSIAGTLTGMRDLTPEIVEIAIETARPVPLVAGQHMGLRFRGYPERILTPTLPVDGIGGDTALRFHVQRLPGGRLSAELGREILPGHKVKLSGPFGRTHFHAGLPGRIVLVASGVGFAPIWAIANAALVEWAERPLLVLVGARTIRSFYFAAALDRLSQFPNVAIHATTEAPQLAIDAIRLGRPTDYLDLLRPGDTVYAAGPPELTCLTMTAALQAGAACFVEDFLPAPIEEAGWLGGLALRVPGREQAAGGAPPTSASSLLAALSGFGRGH